MPNQATGQCSHTCSHERASSRIAEGMADDGARASTDGAAAEDAGVRITHGTAPGEHQAGPDQYHCAACFVHGQVSCGKLRKMGGICNLCVCKWQRLWRKSHQGRQTITSPRTEVKPIQRCQAGEPWLTCEQTRYLQYRQPLTGK